MEIVLSEKQAGLIKSALYSDSPFVVGIGAARSGKSFAAALAVKAFVETRLPHLPVLLAGRTAQSVSLVAGSELLRIAEMDLTDWKQSSRPYGLRYAKKVVLPFAGGWDERAEERIRGQTFAFSWIDEATLVPESFFRQIVARSKKVVVTSNPDRPTHWLRKWLDVNKGKTVEYHFSFADNPVLTDDDRQRLESAYGGWAYDRFVKGLWGAPEGAVFDFDLYSYLIKPEEAEDVVKKSSKRELVIGVDFGFVNATGVTVSFDCGDSFVVLDSWKKTKVRIDELAAEVTKSVRKNLVFEPSRAVVVYDSARPDLAAELESRIGVPAVFIPSEKAERSYVVQRIAEGVKSREILIGGKAQDLVEEMVSLEWDAKRDVPKKEDDHCFDAFQYSFFSTKESKGKIYGPYEM